MSRFLAAIQLLFTLRCKHSSELISSGMDEEWSGVERWAVRLHYLSCGTCRRFRRQMAFVKKAARTAARSADPVLLNMPEMRLRPGARARMDQAIRDAMR